MNFETDLLISQAQTLRYLPPNTYLETDQAEDAQLLNELLSINPDQNPISWLMEARAGCCVQLLLWKILDGLRGNLIGLQRTLAEAASVVNRSELEAGLGYRLNDHDLKLLRPLASIHPLQVDAETLLSIFWRLKRELVPLAAGRLEKPSLELRSELLSLPRQVDPLKWLREYHLQYAAESTLRYLVSQVLPESAKTLFNSPLPISHYPRLTSITCRANDIEFRVNQLYSRFDVFAICIAFTISKRQIRSLDAKQQGYPFWKGIPQLTDDLGNRYLITCGGGRMAVKFPLEWELQFACYPTIAETAKTFSLSFDDVLLTIAVRDTRGGHPGGDICKYYDLLLGDLKWTVDIAALRRQSPGFY